MVVYHTPVTSGFRGCTEAPKEGSSRKSADPVPWHILAHLGTSWLHAAKYSDVFMLEVPSPVAARYLRQEVAQLRRQNAELQNQAWKIIFWDERSAFEIPNQQILAAFGTDGTDHAKLMKIEACPL